MENNATHGIKLRDSIGYALGDMGGVLAFSLVASFLSMFYTDVLGIDASKIAVLMIVARLWDAINDPMWGAFIDSRKPTKWGRFRPYILGASFPMVIGAFLMFYKIPGLSETQYLIYAYVTYIFYGMMYTGTNIPYGSLASVITDDEVERSSLSVWRSVGSGMGGLPAQVLLPLLVYSTVVNDDGTTSKVLDGNKLSLAVGILMVISIFIYIIHFKMTKERVQLPSSQNQSDFNVFRTIKNLLHNKPFIVICIVSMLHISYQMYTQTVYNYLFKSYYNRPELYSFVTICTYLPMALFLPVMSKLVKKFGKKEICTAGLVFAVAANLLMYLIGFTPIAKNPYSILLLTFFSGAGQTFIMMQIWALVMDVIDYQELISGRREEGTSYSFYSFARKLGHTVAGAASAGILAIIGYDGKLAVQPQSVLDKLFTGATLVPAMILIVILLLLAFGYPLSKKELQELHIKLDENRKNEVTENE